MGTSHDGCHDPRPENGCKWFATARDRGEPSQNWLGDHTLRGGTTGAQRVDERCRACAHDSTALAGTVFSAIAAESAPSSCRATSHTGVALLAGVGAFHAAGVTGARVSVGGELTLSAERGPVFARTIGRNSASIPWCCCTATAMCRLVSAVRQALRLQIEQRVQQRKHVTTIALSHVF